MFTFSYMIYISNIALNINHKVKDNNKLNEFQLQISVVLILLEALSALWCRFSRLKFFFAKINTKYSTTNTQKKRREKALKVNWKFDINCNISSVHSDYPRKSVVYCVQIFPCLNRDYKHRHMAIYCLVWFV